jgi:hypothetical protein
MWTGLVWLRIYTGGVGLCTHGSDAWFHKQQRMFVCLNDHQFLKKDSASWS